MKKITIIENQEWYQSVVDDCNSAFAEGFENYRDTLIKTYHLVGRRILEETDNFKKANIYGDRITQTLASSMNKSPRTIEYAIKFAQIFPDLDKLPEGKNISMNKIITKYLTKPKEAHICKDFEEVKELKCKICGKKK